MSLITDDIRAIATFLEEGFQATETDVKRIRQAADELDRLQAIVDGAAAVSRGAYMVQYGWHHEMDTMGYWWGTCGEFVGGRLTWAGTSRQDAWLAIGQKVAEKARTA